MSAPSLPVKIGNDPEETTDRSADDAGDCHALAAAFEPVWRAWLKPMMPKMTASTGGISRQPAGMPMMPSTSDATQNPLLVPAASSVVPSIVKGMPQLLQLLAVIGLIGAAARALDGLLAVWLAKDPRRPFAGGGVGVDGVGVLLDDLPRLGVDQPAIAVEDGDGDRVAAGGALAFLGGHGFGGFEAGRAVAAVEAVSLTDTGPEPSHPLEALIHRRRRRGRALPPPPPWRVRLRRWAPAPRGHAKRCGAVRTLHELPTLRVVSTQRRLASLARKDNHIPLRTP